MINWHEAEAVSPLGAIGGGGIVVVVVVVVVVDLGMVVGVVVGVEFGTVVDVVVVDLGMVVGVVVDVEFGTVVDVVAGMVVVAGPGFELVVETPVEGIVDVVEDDGVEVVATGGSCVGLFSWSVVVVALGSSAPRSVVEVALEPENVLDAVDVADEDGGRVVVVDAP